MPLLVYLALWQAASTPGSDVEAGMHKVNASTNSSCTGTVLLASTTEGFGFRFVALMAGLELAARTQSQLALADNFWARNRYSNGRKGFGPYSFAWKMLPFPPASAVPSCRQETSASIVAGSMESWMAAMHPQACRCAPMDAFGASSCGGKWCAMGGEGNYARGVLALRRLGAGCIASAPLSIGAALPGEENTERSQNATPSRHGRSVEIVWHLRSGDNQVNATREVLERLSAALSAGFPLRGARHAYITSDHAQLRRMYPWLENELGFVHKRTADDEQALRVMASSEVLVSTGSTFPLAAAALAAACESGKQLHVAFPPKELGSHTNSLLPQAARLNLARLAATITAEDILASGWFRSQFIGINSVPVDLRGQPLSVEYRRKLERMLEQFDRQGFVEPSLADLTFDASPALTEPSPGAAAKPPAIKKAPACDGLVSDSLVECLRAALRIATGKARDAKRKSIGRSADAATRRV